MRKLAIFGLLLFILTINITAVAQDEEIEKDVLEISFYSGFASPTGGITEWNDGLNASNGYNMGLDIGYFVTSNFSTGFNFTYQRFDVDSPAASSSSHRLYNPNLFLKYIHTTEGNLEPYVRVHVGLENPKFSTFVSNPTQDRYHLTSYGPGIAYGVSLGLFYFTSDYSGLFIQGTYHGASTSNVTATYLDQEYDFNENISVYNLSLGIRVLVGSDE